MSSQQPPIYGQLQCPEKFYDFVLDRFNTLDKKLEGFDGRMDGVEKLLSARVASDASASQATKRVVGVVAWAITTLIALTGTTAAVVSLMH